MTRNPFERPAHQRGTAGALGPGKPVIDWRDLWSHWKTIMPNIIGLGLDATDIDRIANTIERYGERFLNRIFTEGEVAYCTARRVPAIHFAGRFAAKEAAMKALGTGHSQGVLWRDVEVVRRGGPPQLQLHGGAGRRFAAIGGRSTLLTITHSDDLALAHVLIMGS
jgi:holo-[acyl-carrier protein] synthase